MKTKNISGATTLFIFILTSFLLSGGEAWAKNFTVGQEGRGEDVQAPKLIKKVNPIYPEEARKAGVEGVVVLEATIDVHGKVTKLKVLEGVNDLLNKAAIDAVKQWEYEPVLVDGKPQPEDFAVTIKFKLSDKKDDKGKSAEKKDHPQPKLIEKVTPVYPEEARKAGVEGVVVLEATIDIHGKVTKLKVLEGVNDLLNKAAIDAVKQWKYEPVIMDGNPVEVEFGVAIKFALDKDKKKTD